ncbi:MAG TPA: site-specific DNA-methyltransferase, partial [bacterium]|nr:site-specific DNA-methyltransferase [bacterium]
MRAIQSEQEFATISAEIEDLDRLNSEAERRWENKIVFEPSLSRPLVSFQASKDRAIYRWFKYKEAFSADLVR